MNVLTRLLVDRTAAAEVTSIHESLDRIEEKLERYRLLLWGLGVLVQDMESDADARRLHELLERFNAGGSSP